MNTNSNFKEQKSKLLNLQLHTHSDHETFKVLCDSGSFDIALVWKGGKRHFILKL